MILNTNLKGRLRNTSLPLTSGLLPLFEAVVNSIHAIEEKGVTLDQGFIRVEILRKQKEAELFEEESKRRGPDAKGEILGFRVSDNGIGFDTENMKSFHELDSEHKIAKGGRGVGRLMWLKAFKLVKINSVYKGDGEILQHRSFLFDATSGVSDIKVATADSSTSTGSSVHLEGFEWRYKEYTPKTGKSIAQAILEHCLWYFLRPGGAPDIVVEDEGDTFNLCETFESHMHSSASPDTIKIKGHTFDLGKR